MATPPKYIQIGPFKYTVQVDQEYLDKKSYEREEAIAGLSEFEKQLITINDCAEDYKADTLLHEVLHSCLRATGFDSVSLEEMASEERFICSITPILLDVLRRNPELVLYLVNQDSD